MKISFVERVLLKDLFKSSNGLLDYTLYQRYGIEPDEMFKFVAKFQKQELVIYQEGRLRLTEQGKVYLIKKKFTVFSRDDKQSRTPEKFIAPGIAINEFYIPRSSRISKEMLDLQKETGGNRN